MSEYLPNTAIVGGQRGDEGKGAAIDREAAKYDIVARFGGGQNAGHTVFYDGKVLALHGIPSGIAHEGTVNIIGNGTYMHAGKLLTEIDFVRNQGVAITPDNLKISSAAHLVLPHHIAEDALRENGTGAQGSTKSGQAQVAAAKSMRTGIRMGAIVHDPGLVFSEALEGLNNVNYGEAGSSLKNEDVAELYLAKAMQLADHIIDTPAYLNDALQHGKSLLAEGAQAFLLDIDHGMYPFVTSSGTTAGAVPQGLGVPSNTIERVISVVKATQSHVGGGPFVTEITDQDRLDILVGKQGEVDAERGTTTGRIRRMGHLDLPGINRGNMINGTHEMALTKLDCVPRYGKTALICVGYEFDGTEVSLAPSSAAELDQCTPVYEEVPTWDEYIQDVRNFKDLPENAKHYVEFIEDQTGVPITMIGVGPERDQYITRKA